MSDRLFLLKIKLLDIEPEIYRRFIVPPDITLDRLHDVIQIVMGWQDSHQHGFNVGMKSYTENPDSRENGANEAMFRLKDLEIEKGRTFDYLYDFGDCWQHELTLLNDHHIASSMQARLECIEGAGACPPENVGGVPGYFELCQAVTDPTHTEHEHYKTWYSGFPWYSGIFDSNAFDLEKINHELLRYLRWTRDRPKSWSSTEEH